MKEKVLNYIKKHHMLEQGDGVLLAVSGGPDSICLLHILYSLRHSFDLRLMVAHINHQLRPEHAESDEKYVRDLCAEWDLPFFSHAEDVDLLSKTKGISIEEAGREVRYHYFFKIKEEQQLQKIALGQHGDDNAETILMRLLRGTGPKGLAGIPPHRKDGVIRPLLSSSREEIESYCKEHQLFPQIDESNLQAVYFRNKIRLGILPYLEQYSRNFKDNLKNLGELMREEQDYINYEMEKLWTSNTSKTSEGIVFCLDWIENLFPFQQKEMLRRSIEWVKGTLKEIEYVHIQLILEKMADKDNTTWELQLPQGIRVKRQYEKIVVTQGEKEHIQSFSYPLRVGEEHWIPEISLQCKLDLVTREGIGIIKASPEKAYFDYEKMKGQMFIRNRLPGDTFRPSGTRGTKKLKDFFMDQKVPKEKRDSVPLIVGQDGIIWVVGYRVDERYMVDQNSETILTIQCKYRGGKERA